MNDAKIAVVYDWIDSWGGVERMLLVLHEMFKNASFYTSYIDLDRAAWAKDITINTSYIQRLPNFIKKNRALSVPLYPFAFESFSFDKYDLVISVSSCFAKSIITKPGTKHIHICLSPSRFLWVYPNQYVSEKVSLATDFYFSYLKKWDFIAAQRPDEIISISETIKNRVQQYYKRNSKVIYPPFDSNYWKAIKPRLPNAKRSIYAKHQIPKSKYFLLVSRLEAYKRIDIALEVFSDFSGETLVIAGDGRLRKKYEKYAGKNIVFTGKIADHELAYLYTQAQALIMPQIEDFGYVSLEAQFFGCPVIAYKKGGATETIVENTTGIFFDYQSSESLKKAIILYDKMNQTLKRSINTEGPKNVEKFSKKLFIENIKSVINF